MALVGLALLQFCTEYTLNVACGCLVSQVVLKPVEVKMNEFQQVVLLAILTASVVLQFCAGFLAFRLIRLSRNNPSWIMISVALLLMAVRRVITFYYLMDGGIIHPTDLYTEFIAFVISLLLVSGLFAITPWMRRLYSSADGSSDDSFGALFEKMTCGIAIYEATEKGLDFIICEMNPAAERIDKVARQHVAGRRLTEIFPGVEQLGLLDVLRRVWKTGGAESLPLHYYQDGRIAGWRDSFVYRHPDGKVVAIYTDVSAQIHLQEESENRERKFHLLFEQSPLAYQLLDGEGKILEVNPAWVRLTGLARSSVTGRPFNELLTRLSRQQFQACLDSLKTIESVADMPLELRRKDGVLLNIEMDALPLRSKAGAVVQICCVVLEKQGHEAEACGDVEKQVRQLVAERLSGERRELQRQRLAMFGELTTGMAQLFNTPLAAARSAFSLMREDLSPNSSHYDFALMASRELGCMADTVEQMYRFHEPISPTCEPLNINALLDNTLDLVRTKMTERRIQLQDERAETLPLIKHPPAAVMLTLINPVKNSIQAMALDGVLTLRTGPIEHGGVFVEIEDTGSGIPTEFLPHLFEPFTTFRHNGAEHAGIGLGMAMVRRTLDALGGTVTVHSRVGEGTCVRIALPSEMKISGQGI